MRPVGECGLAVRTAVRRLLEADETQPLLDKGTVGVALSGGADSLALTAATAYVAGRRGLRVHAVVVDHQLQPDSAAIARKAAEQAKQLGAHEADVLTVTCDDTEAAARKARYDALRKALPETLILLGHTRDDQAETVLLGLGRGSGPRSIAGMRPLDRPWGRPLLDLPRATTAGACAELGVEPWQDPHNSDARFTRVRLRREVLPLLEDVLQGGVAAALARTARQLREDADALDAIAAEHRDASVDQLEQLHPAVRRRVLRRWLLDHGARDLTDGHLRAVDDLVGRWRGQGGVWLPGDLVVARAHGRLHVQPAAPRQK